MNKVIAISGSVMQLAFYALIAFLALVILTSNNSLLLGIRSYVVMSGSMEPTLRTGGVIFTKPSRNYAVGDVITFKSGTIAVTHRIVQIIYKGNQTFFKTKGDHNNSADQTLVNSNQVLGIEFISIPNLGKIIAGLKSRIGFTVAVAFPAFVFISYEILTIKDEYKKLNRNIKRIYAL